jgi:hypothetical protein
MASMENVASGAAAGSAFGPWGSVIGAGIGAAASLFGGQSQNEANARQAQMNRDFQASQSQAQMDFQERMRKSQYQTAVADLKAAGLNPMLAYSQGGAGNLAGASGQGATAQMVNPLGEAGTSAREAAMAVANFKQLQTQNQLTQAQAVQSDASANLLDQQAITETEKQALIREEAARERAKQPGYSKFGRLTDSQISNYDASARNARANAAYTEATQPEATSIGLAYKTVPQGVLIERGLRAGGNLVSTAAEAANVLKPKPQTRVRTR